ncbi:MAG TPA: ABC transporter permease [Candidatus Limnocylindrales bacterium]|nr:ABC transporter permease [Candidatus Limnocylindrales bacterium]
MNSAKQFRAAVVIGYMLSITWLRRNLLSLVWLFATPFSLLFIITVTTGGRSFALGVIGSLLLVLSTVGTGLAGDATWYRLETKLQDFFVASPVNQLGYLLGIAFAGLFFASPALVVLLPLLVYIGLPLITLPLVLLSLVGVWLFSSAIGYLVSTFTSNLRNGWQSGLLLSVLIGILPPVFYPAEILPRNILLVTYAIPTTNAALLIRDAMGNTPTLPYWSPLTGWFLIVISLAIALAVTSRVARWRQP